MAAPDQPLADASIDEDELPHTRRQTIVIYAILVVTIGLGLTLIVATGLQWLTQQTPTSILVFHGKSGIVDGTISIAPQEHSTKVRTVEIPSEPDFEFPVFLESGSYSLTVKQSGDVLFRQGIYVAEGSRYDINIEPTTTTKP